VNPDAVGHGLSSLFSAPPETVPRLQFVLAGTATAESPASSSLVNMEVLGAMLLVLPLIGVPAALGARRRDRKGDPKQRDGILASGSIVTSEPRGVEPVPIRPFRRTCGCNTAGCTLIADTAEMKRPSRFEAESDCRQRSSDDRSKHSRIRALAYRETSFNAAAKYGQTVIR
jgi:hypothetical protein